MQRHHRSLTLPAVGTGVLMAAYLLLRPYGDHGSSTSPEAAAAYASNLWIVAHLAGALALAQLARLALRMDDLLDTSLTNTARWSGLAGAVLVLPYYGAETFGLHAIGRAGLADPAAMPLVDEVRNHPAALTTFGLGLVLLAASGVAAAVAWRHGVVNGQLPGPTWALWPLAVAVALVLPQFYLPPTGRMLFGVAYLAAALVLAAASRRPGPATSGGRVRRYSLIP